MLSVVLICLLMRIDIKFHSKVSRPDKLAVHVFEVDEDVDKDEVSSYPTSVCRSFTYFSCTVFNAHLSYPVCRSHFCLVSYPFNKNLAPEKTACS